jgi:hypothetical protein
MPLPISLPYTFANATTAIPLANLDSDLTTLRDGINGIGNGTNALSNVSITGGTITGLTSPIPVASGGTGSANLTLNSVLVGNNTNAVKVVSPGTSGNVLTSNGTTWVSQAPAAGGGVSTITFGSTGLTPSTATSGAVSVAGTLVAANGGTGITSPGTAGNVLTSTGTVWVSQAAAASGVTSLTAGNGITVSASTGAVTVSQDIYTGTTANNTSYPIGTCLLIQSTNSGYLVAQSQTISLEQNTSSNPGFRISGGLTNLTGTWRNRGLFDKDATANYAYLYQRTA